MNWIDEQFSEQTNDEILSQTNEEVIIKSLCSMVRELESRVYIGKMQNLSKQREINSLKKQLRDSDN